MATRNTCLGLSSLGRFVKGTYMYMPKGALSVSKTLQTCKPFGVLYSWLSRGLVREKDLAIIGALIFICASLLMFSTWFITSPTASILVWIRNLVKHHFLNSQVLGGSPFISEHRSGQCHA